MKEQLTPSETISQGQLKKILQATITPAVFENLTAALLGRLLNLPIAVAKSGFQHGGDAGPAGQHGRRFRIECKKYGDSTSLSQRELLGELVQALENDSALEAWILVATRVVPEQLWSALVLQGEAMGVPVIILDWHDDHLASLAALCAHAPDLVSDLVSPSAALLVKELRSNADDAIASLRLELQSWSLGFANIRAQSHRKLQDIWQQPTTSCAELNQNAAGGAHHKFIRRVRAHAALKEWWQTTEPIVPLAAVGLDGVGKTWAVLDWLQDARESHPIVLIIPASACAQLRGMTETNLKDFLADRLYALCGGTRDRAHWLRRIDRLLERPVDEGPVFTLFFDGLNQEPSVPWDHLLKVLQGKRFERRIRIIISTRPHHLDDRMAGLRGLINSPVIVTIDGYDTEPGGELDCMLGFESLQQSDLHPDLIELARRPRLFNLVIRFRERLVEAGQITVHRLLWEYGRDSFGQRAGRSFSEYDWQSWLREIALQLRAGLRNFSLRDLSETATRSGLTENQVEARLSDIIDGRFALESAVGTLRLSPIMVSHALGSALLANLSGTNTSSFDAIYVALTNWLDPITGLDERAEILRAAVSIELECNPGSESPVAGVLVTAWLQTQNVTDGHRRELKALANVVVNPLLDAIEYSTQRVHASARNWALSALRSIDRADETARRTVFARMRRWQLTVSRGLENTSTVQDQRYEARRVSRMLERIGKDAEGPITVLGVPLNVVDRDEGVLDELTGAVLQGFPLSEAGSIFEAAALAYAISDTKRGWTNLKWICLLNANDIEGTALALRKLADDILNRPIEQGIGEILPARAAALILWLTGFDEDSKHASRINPHTYQTLTYANNYIPDPGNSFFSLERRHALTVLDDDCIPLLRRVNRAEDLILDPTFDPPSKFIAEVRKVAESIDVTVLRTGRHQTAEDHHFEQLMPAFARCCPDVFQDITRRKIAAFSKAPPTARLVRAAQISEYWLLIDSDAVSVTQQFQVSNPDCDADDEAYIFTQLLMQELRNCSALVQITRILESDIPYITQAMLDILTEPTELEIPQLAQLLTNCEPDSQRHKNCFALITAYPQKVSGDLWVAVEKIAITAKGDSCGMAFKILSIANARRFGRLLLEISWCWSPQANLSVAHYGSGALIEAAPHLQFDELAERIAPWRLLEAALRRGEQSQEIQLAAAIVGRVIMADRLEQPDPGLLLIIEKQRRESDPFTYKLQPFSDTSDAEAFFRNFRGDEGRAEFERAAQIAIARVRQYQNSGAHLYLVSLASEEFLAVIEHAPELIDEWTQGASEITHDFRRRVMLAEPAYLALCEALLMKCPEQGVLMWRALRKTLTTRILGGAGINELIHLPFRLDTSVAIAMREELLGIEQCNNDEALYELAIAAAYNGRNDWLTTKIANDQESGIPIRIQRAIVLSGFLANNTLPVAGAWPDGEPLSSLEDSNRRSARLRAMEACARHWWGKFIEAADHVQAYAAWVLFLKCADRRAYVWMKSDMEMKAEQLSNAVRTHIALNATTLDREISRKPESLNNNFLRRSIGTEIWPWRGE